MRHCPTFALSQEFIFNDETQKSRGTFSISINLGEKLLDSFMRWSSEDSKESNEFLIAWLERLWMLKSVKDVLVAVHRCLDSSLMRWHDCKLLCFQSSEIRIFSTHWAWQQKSQPWWNLQPWLVNTHLSIDAFSTKENFSHINYRSRNPLIESCSMTQHPNHPQSRAKTLCQFSFSTFSPSLSFIPSRLFFLILSFWLLSRNTGKRRRKMKCFLIAVACWGTRSSSALLITIIS